MQKKQEVYGNSVVEMNQMINSELFKFKSRFTNMTGNLGTANVEKAVSFR